MTDAVDSIGIHFGALAPSVSEQLAAQGLTANQKDLKQWDLDADAITRLYLRDLLTDSQKQAAQKKLFNRIKKSVAPGSPQVIRESERFRKETQGEWPPLCPECGAALLRVNTPERWGVKCSNLDCGWKNLNRWSPP